MEKKIEKEKKVSAEKLYDALEVIQKEIEGRSFLDYEVKELSANMKRLRNGAGFFIAAGKLVAPDKTLVDEMEIKKVLENVAKRASAWEDMHWAVEAIESRFPEDYFYLQANRMDAIRTVDSFVDSHHESYKALDDFVKANKTAAVLAAGNPRISSLGHSFFTIGDTAVETWKEAAAEAMRTHPIYVIRDKIGEGRVGNTYGVTSLAWHALNKWGMGLVEYSYQQQKPEIKAEVARQRRG